MRLSLACAVRGVALSGGVALGCALPTAAAAATATGPTAALQVAGSRASYFVFNARPHATVSGKLTVINVGSRGGGFALYPTDASTGQTSGAVYLSPRAPRRDVGAWIHLSQQRLTLAGGASQTIAFRVAVPARVRGGQHLGGIVAEPDQPSVARRTRRGGKASFQVRVREQAVIAVETNLPGPRVRRLVITGITPGAQSGSQTLLLGLASTGTALTKGAGQITVRDAHGRTRLHRVFALDTFVPQTHIAYPIQVIGRALGAAAYHARVTITYDGHRETRNLVFSIKSKNLQQTFGSHHTDPPSLGQSSHLPLIIGGAAVCLLAVLGLGFALGARRAKRVVET